MERLHKPQTAARSNTNTNWRLHLLNLSYTPFFSYPTRPNREFLHHAWKDRKCISPHLSSPACILVCPILRPTTPSTTKTSGETWPLLRSWGDSSRPQVSGNQAISMISHMTTLAANGVRTYIDPRNCMSNGVSRYPAGTSDVISSVQGILRKARS